MTDRVVLKLEVVEHAPEYGQPTAEFIMIYDDADKPIVLARLASLVVSMAGWQEGLITRLDRWPHKSASCEHVWLSTIPEGSVGNRCQKCGEYQIGLNPPHKAGADD